MRLLTRFVSGVALLLCARAAFAQFDQYTSPGGPAGRPLDRKGQLTQEAEAARLRLGDLRVAPTLALKDVAYVKNLLGAAGSSMPTDLTATVSGGFRAYLPSSSRAMWTGYALPEYVWWQKETDRRRLDGLYGAGFDGFWNRLTLRVTGGSDASQQILTSEIPVLTSARVDHGGVTAELRLTGAIYTFLSGSVQRTTSLIDPREPVTEQLAQLDRDESVGRAGFRWRPTSDWTIGLAAEYSDVNFTDHLPGAINRSNSGTAPVLELSREHGRLYLQADVAQRSLTAKQGAEFAHYDRTTGHVTVSYEITHDFELFVYLNRNLAYALEPDYSYFDDLRHGASLHVKLGRRTRASVFGETGRLGYTAVVPGAPQRTDDLLSYGGALSMDLTKGAVISLIGSSTRFTSDLPGEARSLNTLGITITLAAGQASSAVGP
jgi:hypothetical protein